MKELLNKRYRNYFNANEEEISIFLKLFDKDLLNPNKFKDFQYKNTEIYKINMYFSSILIIFIIPFISKKTFHCNNIYGNIDFMAIIDDGLCSSCNHNFKICYSIDALKKLTEIGDISAMSIYGVMLLKTDKTISGQKKSIQYIKKAAELGDEFAMLNYGYLLYEGKLVPKNRAKAIKYFELSANLGNSDAMFMYASMNFRGDGVQKNIKTGIYYYKKSADLDNVNSLYSYGSILMHGEYQKNDTLAIKY